jgi:hypothetical protein
MSQWSVSRDILVVWCESKIASGNGDEVISSIESSDRKRRPAAQDKITEGKTAALAVGKCQRSTILT